MRIISKFYDYYDIGLSYGIDPKIIYKRKTKTISIEYKKIRAEKNKNTEYFEIAKRVFPEIDTRLMFYKLYGSDKTYLDINSLGCIIFCGHVYPFIKCRINRCDLSNYQYIYSLEKMDEFIDNSNSKKIKQKYYDKKDNFFNTNNRLSFNNFFNNLNRSYINIIDLHKEYDTPIFIYKREYYNFNIIFNPNLKKYSFYQVQDAYTAFQNLSMFMSGILGVKENKILDISDNDLKHMKGFDEKSFRKEPTKKRSK